MSPQKCVQQLETSSRPWDCNWKMGAHSYHMVEAVGTIGWQPRQTVKKPIVLGMVQYQWMCSCCVCACCFHLADFPIQNTFMSSQLLSCCSQTDSERRVESQEDIESYWKGDNSLGWDYIVIDSLWNSIIYFQPNTTTFRYTTCNCSKTIRRKLGRSDQRVCKRTRRVQGYEQTNILDRSAFHLSGILDIQRKVTVSLLV